MVEYGKEHDIATTIDEIKVSGDKIYYDLFTTMMLLRYQSNDEFGWSYLNSLDQ